MPWKETDVMNLRTEFVLRVFEGKFSSSQYGSFQSISVSRW
jgi:hypothetical protein